MEKHIKVYLNRFWDNPLCEICWDVAVDVHHIQERSKFWKKTKHLQDSIDNLIWLCRKHHEQAHWIWKKIDKESLITMHKDKLLW